MKNLGVIYRKVFTQDTFYSSKYLSLCFCVVDGSYVKLFHLIIDILYVDISK